MKIWPVLMAIWWCSLDQAAAGSQEKAEYVSFDDGIERALRSMMDLDLAEARSALTRRSDRSINFACLFAEDLVDFWSYFSKGDPEEFRHFQINQERRYDLLEKSRLADPWKLFLHAELLLRGALADIQMDQKPSAFLKIRKALRLQEANRKKNPDFLPARKTTGLLKALTGTIPSHLEWFAALAGIRGSLEERKQELSGFLQNKESHSFTYLRLEAVASMALIQSYLELRPAEAYAYWLKEFSSDPPGLLGKWISLRLAMRAHHPDVAPLIDGIRSSEMEVLPHLALLRGMWKLQKLDFSAEGEFQLYLKNYRGCPYKREVLQKLSWSAFLRGDQSAFRNLRQRILQEGCSLTDEDQQAYREASLGEEIHPVLLRTRLLFDGGHFVRAEHLISKNLGALYQDPKFRREAAYRMGRISQALDRTTQALSFYRDVLMDDPEHRSYLTANSLLNMGLIYESLKECSRAREYFDKTLATRPDRYQRSIHQKARTGLQRMEVKCKK